MKLRVLYVPEVVGDLAVARDWYDARAPGLGEEFLRMVYAAFSELVDYPNKNEVVHARFRRVLLRRFPYSVYYGVSQSAVTVYGIFHTARDPRIIRERLSGE